MPPVAERLHRGSTWRAAAVLLTASGLAGLSGCGAGAMGPMGNAASALDLPSLDSLIGQSRSQVESDLGQPDHELEFGGRAHLIYSAHGGRAGVVAIFFVVPLPVASAHGALHCLRLTIGPNGTVVDAEGRSFGHRGMVLLGAAAMRSDRDDPRDCLHAFWEPADIERGTRAARETQRTTLTSRARSGDLGAATALARRFEEFEPLTTLAARGDPAALAALGEVTGAAEHFEAAARAGHVRAAKTLAQSFGNTDPLETLARAGSRDAAVLLAHRYGDSAPLRALLAGRRADPEEAEAIAHADGDEGPLRTLAESGSGEAAYRYFEWLRANDHSLPSAWHWLCRAARSGHGPAQREVGYWHRSAVWEFSVATPQERQALTAAGVEPDDATAYAWYAAAARNGDPRASAELERVLDGVGFLSRGMARRSAESDTLPRCSASGS